MASPAVNLIALSYTYTLLGTKFLIGQAVLVMLSAIGIGLGMRLIFETPKAETASDIIIVEEDSDRSDLQLLTFFAILVLIMVTATGVTDPLILKIGAMANYDGILLPRVLTMLLQVCFWQLSAPAGSIAVKSFSGLKIIQSVHTHFSEGSRRHLSPVC